MTVRTATTDELSADETAAIRELLWGAWEPGPEAFTEEDWAHSIGGVHFIVEQDGVVAAHASVVERELHAGEHRLATGYVEAVATRAEQRRRGLASALMAEVGEYIVRTIELGALGGDPAFYERLGWREWRGPTFVRTESGPVRTAEDDGWVLVRLTPRSPELDLSAPISCEWRPGDVW